MKRLASFLLCLLIMLTGCVALQSKTTGTSNPSLAPISPPSPSSPSSSPETPPPRTYLLNSNGALGFGLKSFLFFGRCERNDDTLFNAVYQSLTDAPWTTVAEGAANYRDYLPSDLQADEHDNYCSISEQTALTNIGDATKFKNLQIIKCVREDLNLAYIAIEDHHSHGEGVDAILLLFDIRDGFYDPYTGIVLQEGWDNSEDGYFVTGAGGMRWVAQNGVYLHGTGKLRMISEWWNIDEREVDIAYAFYESEIIDEGSPLGSTGFHGELSAPVLSQSSDENLLRMDFTQSLLLGHSGHLGSAKLTKELPLTIWYDIPCRRAFIEESSVDRWYLGHESYSFRIIYDTFEDELQNLIDTNDPTTVWAEWVLSKRPWDEIWDFMREHGMES